MGWATRAADAGAVAALAALTAVTRLPFAGRSLGEPDGARYALGLKQWLRRGPAAPFIYAKVLSPGYYALAAWWSRADGLAPLAVLEGWSWMAALLTAPLLYGLGRRCTSRGIAAAGAALFLLAPGIWWLGIEPHPQGLAFACLLASLLCFTAAADWRGELAAAVWLAAGLLLKNDLVLFALVYPALRLAAAADGSARRWRALWVPATAGLAFVAARAPLLRMPWARAQGETDAAVRTFLSLPHGVALLKQVLPAATAPGLATFALVAGGWALGWRWRRRPEFAAWRRRWAAPAAAWAAPGAVFWLLIRGNNARHMAPLLLLPLWASLEAWQLWARRRWREHRPGRAGAAAGLALVAGCNWLAPPASSNLTLFPSGDVPASVADLAARTREMDAWMRAGLRQARHADRPPPCFTGNPTLPYLELAAEDARPGAVATELAAPTQHEAMRIGEVRFLEVENGRQAAAAAPVCRAAGGGRPRSLEYTAAGRHRRFLGREWRWLPLARRWYPAAALRLPRRVRH